MRRVMKMRRGKGIVVLLSMLFVLLLLPAQTAEAGGRDGWMISGSTRKFRFSNGKYASMDFVTINGKRYVFDASGKLPNYGKNQYWGGMYIRKDGTTDGTHHGEWKSDSKGIRFMDGKWCPKNTSYMINNKRYYFDKEGYLLTWNGGTRVRNQARARDGKWYRVSSVDVTYGVATAKKSGAKIVRKDGKRKTLKMTYLYTR